MQNTEPGLINGLRQRRDGPLGQQGQFKPVVCVAISRLFRTIKPSPRVIAFYCIHYF